MLLRASKYTWPEEVALAECSEDPAVFKPPPARLTSCLSCASCPRTRFLHRAMVHVGDHHECHNGNTSRKQVCPCMSTTSWATFVLPRLVGHSTFLHVIFVPDSVFEKHAFDVSRPDLYEDSSCFRGEPNSLRKDLLYYGQINKEVVLDKAAASECAVKSFDAMQVEDVGRTASMGHKSNSCICCGSSIEAKLCAELATRMRLMQKLQFFCTVVSSQSVFNPKANGLRWHPSGRMFFESTSQSWKDERSWMDDAARCSVTGCHSKNYLVLNARPRPLKTLKKNL